MATWDDLRRLALVDPLAHAAVYQADRLLKTREQALLDLALAYARALGATKQALVDALARMPAAPIVVEDDGRPFGRF